MNSKPCTHPETLVRMLFAVAKERGTSDGELARRMNMTPDGIYRLKHPDPKAKHTDGVGVVRLRKLADALGFHLILVRKVQ